MLSIVSVCHSVCLFRYMDLVHCPPYPYEDPIALLIRPVEFFFTGEPPGPEPAPSTQPVQFCSICSPYIYRQVGGWPSTERNFLFILYLFQMNSILHP